MPLKFVGKHPEVEWVRTGFYTLDIALRKNYSVVGWPTRTLTHVYGPTSTGKSTFINSVSCVLASQLNLNIACLDLEPQDDKTVEAIANNLGFENEWLWVEPSARKKDDFSDEHLLGQLRKQVKDGYITILDSVASITPMAEVAGNVGDANMGRRAFPMAQYSRLMNRELKYAEKGTFSFMANHRYEKIGTGLAFATYNAPGGVVKENMAHINIENKVPYFNKKQMQFGDVWIFEGKVLKNRFGMSHSDFWVCVVGGQGIHRGLTALFDCVKLGMADIASGNKLVIKDTGEDLGRVSEIIAKRDELSERGFFEQFHDLTRLHQLSSADDAQLQNEEEQESEEDE